LTAIQHWTLPARKAALALNFLDRPKPKNYSLAPSKEAFRRTKGHKRAPQYFFRKADAFTTSLILWLPWQTLEEH